MLSVDNTAILREFAKAEAENSSPRKKIDESRIVYKSRKFESKGVLCDFGEARIGKGHESRPFIQPHIYRSPKTSLKESIYGVFGDIFDAKGGHNASKHLALMVGIVGPPSSELVRHSETIEQCFDPGGKRPAFYPDFLKVLQLEF
ncbi:Protein kinase subdomain-containing protein [Trichophyton interdigitale]|uniref:Protein kinase subdomain-containing protein n=1 Tax=Trichophyton interdigitale TaxID=101480 RepID=A0A9P5CUP7_9EURO|nr:Protein kinase subdomain-containing protein [Trichophyton interdigitale]KAF3893236.1 Protein kinase subdomain-containing protein [Trichophyton interdigitale]KAG8206315.1 Protein kinase subdomain-containing protein [Trichophyton interdigitale]